MDADPFHPADRARGLRVLPPAGQPPAQRHRRRRPHPGPPDTPRRAPTCSGALPPRPAPRSPISTSTASSASRAINVAALWSRRRGDLRHLRHRLGPRRLPEHRRRQLRDQQRLDPRLRRPLRRPLRRLRHWLHRSTHAWVSLYSADGHAQRSERTRRMNGPSGPLWSATYTQGRQESSSWGGSDNTGISEAAWFVDGRNRPRLAAACDYSQPVPCPNMAADTSHRGRPERFPRRPAPAAGDHQGRRRQRDHRRRRTPSPSTAPPPVPPGALAVVGGDASRAPTASTSPGPTPTARSRRSPAPTTGSAPRSGDPAPPRPPPAATTSPR